MKVILTFVLVLCLCYGVKSKCVMKSECHLVNGFPRNCRYNGTAVPVLNDDLSGEQKEDAIRIMLLRCPELTLDENGQIKPYNEIVACCDYAQLRGMADNLLLAEGVLGRCPTCLRNFVRQICELNCSPDQARFVDIDTLPLEDGREYVEEVYYRMHEDFMDNAFDSCSGVIVPQTGLPAVNLMCGNAPVCNSSAWFGFTGDITNNPLAPVQVNFLRTQTIEDSAY
ncbi:NPC intracellular cholesterol transporter 1 homolog 1b-like isoform X2 [Hyposmocoma kahamanoa]|uniref:NPC intracellular cholesterol transporter 1 homolog 1b-like isoform X2 n=1 Tax=Hyposmocoma kahamanoa TaxID=1477025 RepID=UPI000E6DA088|nr:NPC intracellular cholesterol transporter 1 homolog 1b-like isoform X2 [Hyposmocoma kahamanoa]